jgi:hypothetical protein
MEIALTTAFKKAFTKRITDTVSEVVFWKKLETFKPPKAILIDIGTHDEVY